MDEVVEEVRPEEEEASVLADEEVVVEEAEDSREEVVVASHQEAEVLQEAGSLLEDVVKGMSRFALVDTRRLWFIGCTRLYLGQYKRIHSCI